MKTLVKSDITVGTTINAPIQKVWDMWTNPFHVLRWNAASDDWYTPYAEGYPVKGSKFLYRMESMDGSEGFDFSGTYYEVQKYKHIAYRLDDGRNVNVDFRIQGDSVVMNETFEPESENTPELQRQGWQSILDNFKRYVESYNNREVLHYEIHINQKPEHVYRTLIDRNTHSEWTAAFSPTSRFEGSWDKGSEISFLGTDPEGVEGGMVCRIRENIPNKFISVEYLALIKNGEVIRSGKEVEEWQGCLENYMLKDDKGNTLLMVDSETVPEFRDYFKETWPKALKKLKEVCER